MTIMETRSSYKPANPRSPAQHMIGWTTGLLDHKRAKGPGRELCRVCPVTTNRQPSPDSRWLCSKVLCQIELSEGVLCRVNQDEHKQRINACYSFGRVQLQDTNGTYPLHVCSERPSVDGGSMYSITGDWKASRVQICEVIFGRKSSFQSGVSARAKTLSPAKGKESNITS